jgi:hypothetical protein
LFFRVPAAESLLEVYFAQEQIEMPREPTGWRLVPGSTSCRSLLNTLPLFAQGYITARKRLFQMERTRLAGRGGLSTLLGEATLEKDKFLSKL